MRKHLALAAAFALFALACFVGCGRTGSEGLKTEIDPAMLKMFQPLPEVMASDTNPITEEKIALGRMLYYEPRLSKNQDISCNTCHMLDKYGVDGEDVSDGHQGQAGTRNSPTVYNAADHFVQFWDGRAEDVEEQAKGPVLNPVEMAMVSEASVTAVLTSMPEYVEAFQKAFPGLKNPVTFDNVARAIGAFERKLVTPGRWDEFLQGNLSVLTAEEKAGFNAYMEAGCQACHMGAYLGGQVYQKLGAVKEWPDTSDQGRAEVTQREADKMVFKVPSLRNVERTAPYYHDGSVPTMEESVRLMGEYQLGKQLTETEISSIVAWMRTLTGEIPSEYIKMPVLPRSTEATPKPSAD